MEQPAEAVITTPKRRFHVPLPTRTTARKAAVIATAFGLGALVGAKKVKDACACESDANEQTTSDN